MGSARTWRLYPSDPGSPPTQARVNLACGHSPPSALWRGHWLCTQTATNMTLPLFLALPPQALQVRGPLAHRLLTGLSLVSLAVVRTPSSLRAGPSGTDRVNITSWLESQDSPGQWTAFSGAPGREPTGGHSVHTHTHTPPISCPALTVSSLSAGIQEWPGPMAKRGSKHADR